MSTSKSSVSNFDIKTVGPGLWHILHTSAIYAKEQQSMDEFERFLENIKKSIRCDTCLNEFVEFQNKNPLSSYRRIKTKQGLSVGFYIWTWKLHNAVNEKLGKPQADLKDTYLYYSGTSVCFACISSQYRNL